MPAIKKPYLITGGLFGVLALVFGIYALLNAHQESTDDAQIDSDVVPLAARAGGLVTKVYVQEDQRVQVGDLIMQLDEADQLARVHQAEAEVGTAQAQAIAAEAQVAVIEASAKGSLQSAQASVGGSIAAVSSAMANIVGMRAGTLQAEAEVRRTKLDLDRAKRLRDNRAVPQEMLDHAQIAFDEAQARRAQAEAGLTGALDAKRGAETKVLEARGRLGASTPIEAQMVAAHAAVDLAHANVQAASAKLDQQRLIFGYLRITAPVAGTISRIQAHAGHLLQTGQAVGELVPLTSYVVANFKETQLTSMRPGQAVRIEVDAYPGRTLHGKVSSLSGGTGARFSLLPPDNASGNFVKVVQRVPVRILWENPPEDLGLRVGLSATVSVTTD
jgi:membrane fusion protein (multidrug efflux system)